MNTTEKQPYSGKKVFGLTLLCFVLTLVVSCVLVVCVTAHRHVNYDTIAEAAASVPLQYVQWRRDGQTVTLPQYINETCIGDERYSEAQIANLFRDGDFHMRVGEKAGMAAQYLVLHKSHPEDAQLPLITSDDIHSAIDCNASTIRLHLGLNDAAEIEPLVQQNAAAACEAYNTAVTDTMTKGLSAFCLNAAVSSWIWYVLGGLLLVLLIWMTVIHVKGKKSVGTAFKTFSTAAFIPCTAMLLWGALCVPVLGWTGAGYLQNAARILRGTWLTVGVIGALGCVALFGIGAIAGQVAAKKAAAPAPAPAQPSSAPVQPAEEQPQNRTRRFCRFCGEPLVNNDAMFCYKCGTQQAKIDLDKPETDEVNV